MLATNRREWLKRGAAALSLAGALRPRQAYAQTGSAPQFMARAFALRDQASAAGDQPYGAVVVKDALIVGWGPSRVVTDRNPNAHAERVAIWDAQARLGGKDLGGALLYSTSRACGVCEAAAAGAGIGRMYWGPRATDAGAPRAR